MGYLVNHIDRQVKENPHQLRRGFMSVQRVGLEPTHPEGYWILNPARLSIPLRQAGNPL